MSITFTQSVPVGVPKIGRNDPCPCGSGKKYKKCHLQKDAPAPNNPHAEDEFDALCRSYTIPIDSIAIIKWNRERKAKEFDLSYFIELFAAYAPGNEQLHTLLQLTMQIIQNHPGKPDPTVAQGDPNRISHHSFAMPDIDQKKTYGRTNKALALTKMQDYLKALETYATVLPTISDIEEQFRVFLNIGVCLIEFGQMELGQRYFEKSIQNNPSYAVARKNFNIFNDEALTKQQEISGGGMLIAQTLEKDTWLAAIDMSPCPMIRDIATFLTFVQTHRVSITKKQRLLTLGDAKLLNQLLTHPDPDVKNQWQYLKISWLYTVCYQAGFLRIEHETLRLSRLGRDVYLAAAQSRQLAWIFKEWSLYTDWEAFIPSGWIYESESELMHTTQTFAPQIYSYLAQSVVPCTAIHCIIGSKRPIPEKPNKTMREKEQETLLLTLLASRVEQHIFEPLLWMGILFSNNSTFTVTPFGRTVLDALTHEANTLIPKIIVESALP